MRYPDIYIWLLEVLRLLLSCYIDLYILLLIAHKVTLSVIIGQKSVLRQDVVCDRIIYSRHKLFTVYVLFACD